MQTTRGRTMAVARSGSSCHCSLARGFCVAQTRPRQFARLRTPSAPLHRSQRRAREFYGASICHDAGQWCCPACVVGDRREHAVCIVLAGFGHATTLVRDRWHRLCIAVRTRQPQRGMVPLDSRVARVSAACTDAGRAARGAVRSPVASHVSRPPPAVDRRKRRWCRPGLSRSRAKEVGEWFDHRWQ